MWWDNTKSILTQVSQIAVVLGVFVGGPFYFSEWMHDKFENERYVELKKEMSKGFVELKSHIDKKFENTDKQIVQNRDTVNTLKDRMTRAEVNIEHLQGKSKSND